MKLFSKLVGQIAYTMFITGNHASFHLWWKENLVKNQKVSKYYIRGCLQKFCLVFMSLMNTRIVKKRLYFGWNLLYLSQKTSRKKLESLSITKLDLSERIEKVVTKQEKIV